MSFLLSRGWRRRLANDQLRFEQHVPDRRGHPSVDSIHQELHPSLRHLLARLRDSRQSDPRERAEVDAVEADDRDVAAARPRRAAPRPRSVRSPRCRSRRRTRSGGGSSRAAARARASRRLVRQHRFDVERENRRLPAADALALAQEALVASSVRVLLDERRRDVRESFMPELGEVANRDARGPCSRRRSRSPTRSSKQLITVTGTPSACSSSITERSPLNCSIAMPATRRSRSASIRAASSSGCPSVFETIVV